MVTVHVQWLAMPLVCEVGPDMLPDDAGYVNCAVC